MPMKLSVVMPAYNEEGAIREAVAEVQRLILDKVPQSEMVVVNDGSRDQTGKILDEICAVDNRVRPVHQANGGHGPAVIRGAQESRGEYIFFLDSDRQIAVEDFFKLWKEIELGAAAAFGIRRRRHDPRIRLLLTRVIRWSLFVLFGVYIWDSNVPFKVFRSELWKKASPLIPPTTLAPSLFFAIWVFRSGTKVVCTEVQHRERETGVGSLNVKRLLKFCHRAFLQLLEFRRNLNV